VCNHLLVQFFLPLARLRRQNVTAKGMAPDNFARTGLLETFGRTFVSLQFRHKKSFRRTAETKIIARDRWASRSSPQKTAEDAEDAEDSRRPQKTAEDSRRPLPNASIIDSWFAV